MTPSPTAPNAATALARVVVDELVRRGVTEAVLAPGSRSTALALALDAHPAVRLHVELDERSAGFLAVGAARGSGRPAVVLTTSGSATANLHPAVVEADTGGVPLLVLTADRPPELHHTGANQTVEQAGMYGGAVRAAVDLPPPEDVPGAARGWRDEVGRAVAAALGAGAGVAGPVHLNLAFREPTVPRTDDGRTAGVPFSGDLDAVGAVVVPELTSRAPSRDDVAALCSRLSEAERGLVVAGDGAGPTALDLAARLGWPLVAEPHSGARSGEDLVAHAGPIAGAGAASLRPDLVLRLGRTGLSRAIAGLLGPGDVVTVTGSRWHDHGAVPGQVIRADVGETVAAVLGGLPHRPRGAWVRAWREADAAVAAAVRDTLEPAGLTEPGVARAVVGALPAGASLFVASSRPIRDVDSWVGAIAAPVLANRGASGIDGIASTVLGAALVRGPVVALTGDLSLLHDANGFLLRPDGAEPTAVFVVVDNDGGGLFHALPQAGEPAFERLFGTPHGRDLADLARFHRLGYRSVDDAGDLGGAVAAAVAAGGIHLLHVRTERVAAQRLQDALQREVRAAVAAAVS